MPWETGVQLVPEYLVFGRTILRLDTQRLRAYGVGRDELRFSSLFPVAGSDAANAFANVSWTRPSASGAENSPSEGDDT
jgi:hypothetical protein